MCPTSQDLTHRLCSTHTTLVFCYYGYPTTGSDEYCISLPSPHYNAFFRFQVWNAPSLLVTRRTSPTTISTRRKLSRLLSTSSDVTTDHNFDGRTWPCDPTHDLDALFSGAPCISFSIAGKGEGEKGAEGRWLEYTVEYVVKTRRKAIVLENSDQIFSAKHITYFQLVLNTLMRGAGYWGKYEVPNTRNYGLPQNRAKTCVVAIRFDFTMTLNFPNQLI